MNLFLHFYFEAKSILKENFAFMFNEQNGNEKVIMNLVVISFF